MINRKKSHRIAAAKYLLVVPALAAVLLTVQISGLQATETNVTNIADENHVQALATGINESNTHVEATVAESEKTVIVATNIVITQDAPESIQHSGSGKHANQTSMIQIMGTAPLIILDGKIISREEMNKINPASIESFSILKNENATNVYGEKGKNGVIIIKSKTGTNPVSPQEPAQAPAIYETIPDYRIRQGTVHSPKNEVGDIGIRIRGVEQGAQPLIIVDGKEFDGSSNSLSADSIESISVLKNPAAIAVYGEKGKNGVILVTTKKTGTETPNK